MENEDMVMLTSMDLKDDCITRDRKVSSNSDDDSVAVLYKNGCEPQFLKDNDELTSLSIVCSQDGPPLEQRDDIVLTKKIPEKLKEVLNFNCEVKLREVEDQMKARENIDQDMENEIENIKNMEANNQLEDPLLRDAARNAREKSAEVRQVAKAGRTTLKRAMEIIEVALPPFLTACVKSYEKNDLSEDVEKECQEYETCLAEKRRAGLNFDLGEQKALEAEQHLQNCIKKAKEDEEKISEKQKKEKEFERLKVFTDAKREMDDIIKSELDEVHNCLRYCKGDLQNIDSISEAQGKRFHLASRTFQNNDKTLDTKINVNRKNQDDLRAQLAKLEEQERSLVERRKFEQEVQDKAEEWHVKVSEQMAELKNSILNVQSCASTSLKVMELMKEGGSGLLSAAIKSEEQYLNHIKDLDVEAKTKWRTALATSAVEKRLAMRNLSTNIDDYKEKYRCLKEDLNKAVQRQKRLDAENLNKEIKQYRDELRGEEKKKKKAEGELNMLMEQIIQCDENLLQLGRHVDTVDTLYEHRIREEDALQPDGLSSIEFSQDEDSDDD